MSALINWITALPLPQQILVWSFLLELFRTVFSGIIGNRSDWLFVQIAKWLWNKANFRLETVFPWLVGIPILITLLASLELFLNTGWLLTGIVFLGLLEIAWCFLFKESMQLHLSEISHSADGLEQLLKLDASLLKLLSLLRSGSPAGRHERLRKVLNELLRDSIQLFSGDIVRGSILLVGHPELKTKWPAGIQNDKDYLFPWGHSGMTAESIERTFFYTGDSEGIGRMWGVAGIAYRSGQLQVVHFDLVNNRWVPTDSDHYLSFDHNRTHLPYRSFVAVPLMFTTPTRNGCLGVLCFDSMDKFCFDSREVKEETLPILAQRVVTAILIHEAVERKPYQRGR